MNTFVNHIQDFPKPGIMFRDLSPLLANEHYRSVVIDSMTDLVWGYNNLHEDQEINTVVGIEARGFAWGAMLAQRLRTPFIQVRKFGKLPGPTHNIEYSREYGPETLSIQNNVVDKDSICVIVDDVLATGGTVEATRDLLRMRQAQVPMALFVLELQEFHASERLANQALLTYSIMRE